MRNKIKFVKWLSLKEYADYGFSDMLKYKQKSNNKLKEKPENTVFKTSAFLDHLTDLIEDDNIKVIRKWADQISWTDNGHPMEVNINTLGTIITKKLIKNITGKEVPLCKDVLSVDEINNGKENLIADKIYNRIKNIRKNNYDNAVSDYNGLEKLAKLLFKACLETYPYYIMFPKGLKKIDHNYYKVFFEYKGGGAGAPDSSRAEQFNIDLSYNKEEGLIRCWAYEILSAMKRRDFLPQPSEWNEYFSPKEKPEKIIKLIIKFLMSY